MFGIPPQYAGLLRMRQIGAFHGFVNHLFGCNQIDFMRIIRRIRKTLVTHLLDDIGQDRLVAIMASNLFIS